MQDALKSWIIKLACLQHCVMHPEQCTHDRNENGEIQPFDYASIDMCLGQVIAEMKQMIIQE